MIQFLSQEKSLQKEAYADAFQKFLSSLDEVDKKYGEFFLDVYLMRDIRRIYCERHSAKLKAKSPA